MKRVCGTPTQTASLHPSIRIGGTVVERCQRRPLPTMVVCEFHATPGAIRLAMESLAKLAKKKVD